MLSILLLLLLLLLGEKSLNSKTLSLLFLFFCVFEILTLFLLFFSIFGFWFSLLSSSLMISFTSTSNSISIFTFFSIFFCLREWSVFFAFCFCFNLIGSAELSEISGKVLLVSIIALFLSRVSATIWERDGIS